MDEALKKLVSGVVAVPRNQLLMPLADLPDETPGWPRFNRQGQWQICEANPLAQMNADGYEPFRLSAIPADWPTDLGRQIQNIEAYCGTINNLDHVEQEIERVAGHRALIERRFGAGLAARTLYLAVAGPKLMHEAAERHFRTDYPGHGELVEKVVFDFLKRQTCPRRFHHALRVSLSATTLGQGADYKEWLSSIPPHSVRIVALVAPFAGVSIDAGRLDLRLPGLERRSFVEMDIFVLTQLAAQFPAVISGTTLVGPADILRLTKDDAAGTHSCGLYLDDRLVQVSANDNWLADPSASGVLAIL